MPMRDYENLKDITIPPEKEAIKNIVCEAWEECHESNCTNCPDRPKKLMSIMECFSLKFSRKLMEAGYAPVVRCKDGRFDNFGESIFLTREEAEAALAERMKGNG